MKVIFLIDSLQTGGSEKSILEIASRFKKIKPLICYQLPKEDLITQFRDSQIEFKCLQFQHYSFLSRVRKFNLLVKQEQPDLIVSILFKSDILARLSHIINRVPLVGTFVNDSYSKRRYKEITPLARIKLKVLQYFDRITSPTNKAFISNGEFIKKSNAENLSVNPNKIKVIRRGRNIASFSINEQRDLEVKKFLAIGRLIFRKGHLDLIRAMKKIVEKYPNSKLDIAGDGPMKSHLQLEINKYNLQSNITLLGNRSDIPHLLWNSSYFVLPSHYEGFSGALIEAMISGIPIIASDIPMNLEAVSHEYSALIYKCGDVDDLATTMLRALENPAKICELGSNARKEAIKEFDIENISSEFEEFLISQAN